MKTGLLAALIVCLASSVLAASPDTCGPEGCELAKETLPVPSIVQSDWKNAVLPPEVSKASAKPPAAGRDETIAPKPTAADRPTKAPKPTQAPTKAQPSVPSQTLDSGFMEQELLPDPMGMAQKVLPEIPSQVRLSNSDINRVICPVDIKDAIYSEEKGMTVNLAGKNAFVKFLVARKEGKDMYSTTPSELYVVCDGAVYTMIAMPSRIPAQTVQLAAGRAQTVKKNMDLYGELPFEKKIIAIVKRVYMNDPPDSFTRIAVNRKMEIFQNLEVTLRSIYAIEGEGLRVKEFEVRISPSSTMGSISYKENDFLRTDVSLHPVAVSVESMTLRKGETSRVFVVERAEGGQ